MGVTLQPHSVTLVVVVTTDWAPNRSMTTRPQERVSDLTDRIVLEGGSADAGADARRRLAEIMAESSKVSQRRALLVSECEGLHLHARDAGSVSSAVDRSVKIQRELGELDI